MAGHVLDIFLLKHISTNWPCVQSRMTKNNATNSFNAFLDLSSCVDFEYYF